MYKTALLSILLVVANFAYAEETNKNSANARIATAVFAGGCFWCMEKPYDVLDGVLKTESGYSGGRVKNPSYEQVSAGGTGHYEALQVTYDPAKVSYAKLLEVFWKNIDPFDARGQFCDKGQQYQAAIFVASGDEKAAAEASLAAMQKQFGEKKIVTDLPAATFYPAEDYHQDYYLKNPVRYKYYRFSCGRDQRLQEIADSLKNNLQADSAMHVTHIHHLNFIVRDLDEGIQCFATTLGCSVDDFIRDQLTGRNVATARIKLGETWLVLVSPLSEQGAPAEHLRQHGEGFFLLSLGVDDFAPAVADLQQRSVSMTTDVPRQGLDNWQVWDIDAAETLQIQIQYCKESD